MVERERETVVVNDGGRRGSGGTIVAVLAIIALLVVLYLVFGQGMIGGGETTDVKVDIAAPTSGGSGS